MDILLAGRGNVSVPEYTTKSTHFDSSEPEFKSIQPAVHVSISQEAKEKHDEEVNQDDKQDFGESLRAKNSQLNSAAEKQNLSLEEKIEQHIEEVKEQIKEVQKEIQALKADGGTKAEEKIKILSQKVQALFAELNGLMEQKLELMKRN